MGSATFFNAKRLKPRLKVMRPLYHDIEWLSIKDLSDFDLRPDNIKDLILNKYNKSNL